MITYNKYLNNNYHFDHHQFHLPNRNEQQKLLTE
jgi:hypothetical protein